MAQGLPALVGSALIALLSAAVLFSCQKGPAPQTGRRSTIWSRRSALLPCRLPVQPGRSPS